MAISNHERVGKALELLRLGLGPFVERELENLHGEKADLQASYILGEGSNWANKSILDYDVAALIKLMSKGWNEVFNQTLGQTERNLLSELREVRNRWAHQDAFSTDDTYRAFDSLVRLLTSVSAAEAAEVDKMRMELLRHRFDEQVRGEKRKSAATAIKSQTATHLTPWRDIVTPHKDVASGRYQQAEFAADLWQVHIGEGSDEYKDPTEFFRRTFLTESLTRLLVGAAQRLCGSGGDPVVQLQTNFGGGKTHSMLALYHLFSGTDPSQLPGVDDLLAKAEVKSLPSVRRVVLVGNKISPGNPSTKPDGTVVHTLWGELAWQLGGAAAYARIAPDDKRATSPGDLLRELFVEYGPCLILIDEWVAYARQLHENSDLPGGSFETQFTFAQALTESAKLAGNSLLVVSVPASDITDSSHSRGDDAEVGGVRGREALDRLRNVIGRVDSSWRPASAEEGFEIVRRRLFEPLVEPGKFTQRDVVARAFFDLYRTQQQEFPPECHNADYETRIKSAYPIHPEIFDRLYSDWSTLVKFQRTRGVLRLMAAVIHSLWENGDKNALILPSTIPIDDQRVQFELTRYLPDSWIPVIVSDVDGPGSLPLRIDSDVTNLGKVHATRRVARTIYLGSAPTADAAHRGIEERSIKLGCVIPGEAPSIFSDALRRLVGSATYLYQDGSRAWYSTQPTVTKLAEDRAEQLKRDPDTVMAELDNRLRSDLKQRGDFLRIHPMPRSGTEVPDDLDTRLVVLGSDFTYSKEAGNKAETAAKAILEMRGSSPRLYKNTLVFLAADTTRMQDLNEAVRKYIAWDSILTEKDALNLDPHQVKQAEIQRATAESTLTAQIPETYHWLLVPAQADPHTSVEWQAIKLSGQESLATRASKKLRNDDSFVTSFAPTVLRMNMDKIPLWRGEHVAIQQLIEDFASYIYLPRLKASDVLLKSIDSGLSLMMWADESFAYADSYDEAAGRYRGLRCGDADVNISDSNTTGLLVKPDIAFKQRAADQAAINGVAATEMVGIAGDDTSITEGSSNGGAGVAQIAPRKRTRFHGSVLLDEQRVGRDAARIADEVIANLVALVGADVRVTLEIEAYVPAGTPDNVIRTVTENATHLKFTTHGFE